MADELAIFSSNSRCTLSADVKIFKKPQEQNCAALLAFVSMLWCTEALPLFITSTLIPLLAGRLLCMLSCKQLALLLLCFSACLQAFADFVVSLPLSKWPRHTCIKVLHFVIHQPVLQVPAAAYHTCVLFVCWRYRER